MEPCINARNNITDILALFHEAKRLAKCNGSDHVEYVPLSPETQIDNLALHIKHCIGEQLAAGVDEILQRPYGGHRNFLRHRSLQGLVRLWVRLCEHAIHFSALIRHSESRIKLRLK